MSQTIAIYGGRFDPFHLGHLAIVNTSLQKLPIDKLIVVPSGQPQHQQVAAKFLDRFNMCTLACAAIDNCEVSDVEANDEKSFTLQSINKLTATENTNIFIIGIDAFLNLPTWMYWQELFNTINWLVIPRNNVLQLPSEGTLAKMIKGNVVDEFAQLNSSTGKVFLWQEEIMTISSQEILTNINSTKQNWQSLLPTEVAQYIKDEKIYQS